MTRIELTIKVDYLPTWGAWEGVRELVQNAKDAETQLNARMTVAHDATAGRLSIVSEGVTLATETLLLGQTTKVGTGRGDLIGQFGECMKLGLLALVRAGHAVSITNGADRWAPAIVDSPTFGVKVLAVDVTPGAAVTRRQVRIDVDGITTATWAEYRERFLFLAKPAASERTATAAGDATAGRGALATSRWSLATVGTCRPITVSIAPWSSTTKRSARSWMA